MINKYDLSILTMDNLNLTEPRTEIQAHEIEMTILIAKNENISGDISDKFPISFILMDPRGEENYSLEDTTLDLDSDEFPNSTATTEKWLMEGLEINREVIRGDVSGMRDYEGPWETKISMKIVESGKPQNEVALVANFSNDGNLNYYEIFIGSSDAVIDEKASAKTKNPLLKLLLDQALGDKSTMPDYDKQGDGTDNGIINETWKTEGKELQRITKDGQVVSISMSRSWNDSQNE